MRIETLSVFPEAFYPYMDLSIVGRARSQGLFEFEAYNLRDWTHDRHKTVDDAPFGGGPGMLMKPEPLFEAIESITDAYNEKPHVIFFAPFGTQLTHKRVKELAVFSRLLFVCGRYEGIDERAFELADEIISLGDYVLSGGELAALVTIDALVRQLPGALGDSMSAEDESFTQGLLEYAQYTRPASFRGMDVPEVLLSGNHAEIAAWRRRNALEKTARLRPDLLSEVSLSEEELQLVTDITEHPLLDESHNETETL